MKLLTKNINYDDNMEMASKLKGVYDKPIIFHCYWSGPLNEKHLYSILSCYYFNVHNNKHKIILWIENNIKNKFNNLISKYCEIKQFSLEKEIKDTIFITEEFYFNKNLPHYSDVVRCLLLFNQGGCWFDLDCFFLRSFDPLFKEYESEVCIYRWQHRDHPNNAIFFSLKPKFDKMKKNIEFIIARNKGWGFQEAQLTYHLELDFLILPCFWFDPGWVDTPTTKKESFKTFFKSSCKEINFNNFFKSAFTFHWHNKWKAQIEVNSIPDQLIKIIKDDMNIEENY